MCLLSPAWHFVCAQALLRGLQAFGSRSTCPAANVYQQLPCGRSAVELRTRCLRLRVWPGNAPGCTPRELQACLPDVAVAPKPAFVFFEGDAQASGREGPTTTRCRDP